MKTFRGRTEKEQQIFNAKSQKEWYENHSGIWSTPRAARVSALATIKLELGCSDCGYREYPEALDFDHIRGEKSFGISTLWGGKWTIEELLEEVEKCEVVCANCHRIRTLNRRRASY